MHGRGGEVEGAGNEGNEEHLISSDLSMTDLPYAFYVDSTQQLC